MGTVCARALRRGHGQGTPAPQSFSPSSRSTKATSADRGTSDSPPPGSNVGTTAAFGETEDRYPIHAPRTWGFRVAALRSAGSPGPRERDLNDRNRGGLPGLHDERVPSGPDAHPDRRSAVDEIVAPMTVHPRGRITPRTAARWPTAPPAPSGPPSIPSRRRPDRRPCPRSGSRSLALLPPPARPGSGEEQGHGVRDRHDHDHDREHDSEDATGAPPLDRDRPTGRRERTELVEEPGSLPASSSTVAGSGSRLRGPPRTPRRAPRVRSTAGPSDTPVGVRAQPEDQHHVREVHGLAPRRGPDLHEEHVDSPEVPVLHHQVRGLDVPMGEADVPQPPERAGGPPR